MHLLVCDNPKKCIFDTLRFAHVKTGETSEDRITIVNTTTHQSIYYQVVSNNA